jgi:hypothetical protein
MFMKFTSAPGDYVGNGQTRTLTPSEASFSAAVGCRNNKVSGWIHSATSDWLFTFAAPYESALTPGTYEYGERSTFRSAAAPGLDIAIDGRGCNQLIGHFVVLDAVYAPDETVERFRVTFVQHCENISSALTGEIALETPSPEAARRQFHMGCP